MIGYFRFKLIDVLRGTNTVERLDFLNAVQFETPTAVRQRMNMELDRYLNALRSECLIYREKEFQEFPIIDKAFANRNRSQLINNRYSGKTFMKQTGGSTGEPFVYLTGKESQSYLWSAILLSWRIAGYRLGDPAVFLAGSSIFGTGWKQKILYKLMNVNLLSAFDMTEGRMRQYVRKIETSKARIVYGYAAALHRLAQHILSSQEKRVFSLRGVVCTAEVLTSKMRKDIEKAFEVPCFSQYGCNDAGISAYECERKNGFHLITTRCYPEVLSDGRLVSTDMSNTAFFLPRYDSGDIVEISDTPCPCGRGFPLITNVIGRANDLVVDREQKTVHSEFFSHLFRKDQRIKTFQVTFDEHRLNVNLHTSEEHGDWLMYIERIGEVLTFDRIELALNEPMLASKNGKIRSVMRIETRSE